MTHYIIDAINNLYAFLIILSIKLKSMSEKEFIMLMDKLDYEQKIYAMALKYF